MAHSRTTPRLGMLGLAMIGLAMIGLAMIGLAAPPADALAGEPPDLPRSFAAEFDLALDAADRDFDEIILAHSGGLSIKDNCHNDRDAGERHWHRDGTAERGGECIVRDGRTVKVQPEVAVDAAELENLRLRVEAAHTEAAGLRRTIDDLRAQRNRLAGEADSWESRARRAEGQIDSAERALGRASAAERGANADAAAALAKAEEARKIAADAELRARGVGPRVDRRCRTAVEEIVLGETGWLSDSVKVDEEGRAVLSRACMSP